MGKKSREKGAAWERECANKLSELTGVECRRNLRQYQVGGSDIESRLPLSVECKTGYAIGGHLIGKALQQAADAAQPNELPLVWIKRNVKGRAPQQYIVMDEDVLLPVLVTWLRR